MKEDTVSESATGFKPWRLSRTGRYVMDGIGGPWICEVTQRPGWEAHARLIAAAPALYEALRNIRDNSNGWQRDAANDALNKVSAQ